MNKQTLIKEMKLFFKDHYEHFNGYPMEFEYKGIVYDFDECAELMRWTA